MRHVLIAAATALLMTSAAEALPVPVVPGPGAADGLTLVREGCGFGAHRGPYGGCRLNRGPRGAIRGLVTGRPRPRLCPPGTHRIPRSGVCRRNF